MNDFHVVGTINEFASSGLENRHLQTSSISLEVIPIPFTVGQPTVAFGDTELFPKCIRKKAKHSAFNFSVDKTLNTNV